jgi:hypothetical protein
MPGIDQQGTPWADGVPGLSQRPIQPGQSYKYKWYANAYGSYFYHAHSNGQIDDGCYGPIIIKPKMGIQTPYDKIAPKEVELLKKAASEVKPIVVSDWRHTTSQHTTELQIASGIESSICMDSILTNGKGAVNCWSKEDITKFTSPAFAPLLAQFNLTMTAKGYVDSKSDCEPSLISTDAFLLTYWKFLEVSLQTYPLSRILFSMCAPLLRAPMRSYTRHAPSG